MSDPGEPDRSVRASRADRHLSGEDPDLLTQAAEVASSRSGLSRSSWAIGWRPARSSCPCHLAVGQEAVAVGVSRHLRPSDRVFGNHRSHGHFLALGGSTSRC